MEERKGQILLSNHGDGVVCLESLEMLLAPSEFQVRGRCFPETSNAGPFDARSHRRSFFEVRMHTLVGRWVLLARSMAKPGMASFEMSWSIME
jgi:hypothetical protein